MSSTATLSSNDTQILEVCCEIEEISANLYRYFSKLYADNPQASSLWEKTAEEEDNHAEQFRLASRLTGSCMQSLKTDVYKVTMLRTKITSIFAGVQKSPPPLKEAFRFAIKLEESMADYHMNTIATFDDENLARLFASMMNNDKKHIQMLVNSFEALC